VIFAATVAVATGVAPGKLGLPGGRSYWLTELWTGGVSVPGKISATVPAHGVALLRITTR
jgi:hypothetical protein